MRWTLETIAALTDPGTLQRGRVYAAASGRVTDVRTAADGVVTARVAGKSAYKVRLTDSGGTCDCPMGEDGVFCKHCVAVALAVAEQPDLAPISDWLTTLDRSVLVELVEDAATMSEAFARQLELRMAAPRKAERVEAVDASSLLDDDPDAAWEVASANPEAVEDDVWLQLAVNRSADFPADVVPVYRMLIDKLLLTANRNNYSDAVRLLKRMERAADAAGEPHPREFTTYVCELREAYERRPSFIAILDRADPYAGES